MRSGEKCIFVTTDAFDKASCLDWLVGLVVSFDLPVRTENYLQRVGRSAKFNVKTTAVSFVPQGRAHVVSAIEEFFATRIEQLPEKLRL